MPRRLSDVTDLVSEIRNQLDELNVDAVSTQDRILPTLNRGLDYSYDLLSRRYPDPYLANTMIPLVSGTQEYDLPEDCFEDRILRVEIRISNAYQEVRRVSFYDSWQLEVPSAVAIPSFYCMVGRRIRLLPSPTGTYPMRIWYVQEPEQLVLPQGRITVVNQPGNYVIVDQAGDDLSTEADTLESYVNLIDAQTGKVKWTGQIAVLDGAQVTFRTSPLRTDVLNRTVSGTLPLSSEDPTVAIDDSICAIQGTCVPPSGALRNFLVEFSVAEILRSLGRETATEEQILLKFERQIDKYDAGRENTMRVQRRSNAYGRPARRWFINQR